MGKSKDKEPEEPAFNGAIQTLNRIDELIQHISAYRVNGHIIGLKENLGELLIEAQGFLTKPEFKKAWRDWDSIDSYSIDIDKDDNVIYDSALPFKLFKFSAWLRLRLHKHNITMPKKGAFVDGFNRTYSRYGLGK